MPRWMSARSCARDHASAPPASRRAPGCRRCRRATAAGRSRRWRCSAAPARSSVRRTAPTRPVTSCRVGCADMVSRAACFQAYYRRDPVSPGCTAATTIRPCRPPPDRPRPRRTRAGPPACGRHHAAGRARRRSTAFDVSRFDDPAIGACAPGAARRSSCSTSASPRWCCARCCSCRSASRSAAWPRSAGALHWLDAAWRCWPSGAGRHAAVAGQRLRAARPCCARVAPWRARRGRGGCSAALAAVAGWALLLPLGMVDASAVRRLFAARAGRRGARRAGRGPGWTCARALRTPADASARLAELQSRIRPHFLFNALNTALALVRVDPERAESVLEDLAAAVPRRAGRGRRVGHAGRGDRPGAALPGDRAGALRRAAGGAAGRSTPRHRTRARAAAGAAAAGGERRAPRHRAVGRPAARSACARRCGAARRVLLVISNSRARQPARPATAWRWPTCASACACCTTSARAVRRLARARRAAAARDLFHARIVLPLMTAPSRC